MKYVCLVLFAAVTLGCGASKENRPQLEAITQLYLDGKLDEAIPKLTKYVEEYPQDDMAWTILGNAYQEAEQLDDARVAYEKALELVPKQVQALTAMGILHRKREDYDTAMDYYEQAVAIDPNHAEAYSSMVTIALKRGDDDKAVQYGEKAHQLSPDEPVIAANLAIAYHYKGMQQKRDDMTKVAQQLGYKNMALLYDVIEGRSTIRDEQ